MAAGILSIPSSSVAEDTEKPLLDSMIGSDVLSVSSFVDLYFSDDFNNFEQRKRPYLTQPQLNDEGNINLGDLSIKLQTERFRSTLTGQYGTSVDANYAAEKHEAIKYLQEGYVGFQPVDKLWIDVGVFLSHIGMESWKSKDNIAYTRALISEFSPYYESGVRVGYEFSDKLSAQILAVNGWQNISYYDGRWAFGSLINYKPDSDSVVGWSTFFGNESDDARIFNDLYYRTTLLEKLSVGISGDVGYQNTENGDWWFGWNANAEYKIMPKIGIVGRVEQYVDRGNVIVSTPDGQDFATFAYSLGLNTEIAPYLLWRSEVRLFNAENKIFPEGSDGSSAADSFFVTSLSYTF